MQRGPGKPFERQPGLDATCLRRTIFRSNQSTGCGKQGHRGARAWPFVREPLPPAPRSLQGWLARGPERGGVRVPLGRGDPAVCTVTVRKAPGS